MHGVRPARVAQKLHVHYIDTPHIHLETRRGIDTMSKDTSWSQADVAQKY
jgi:hypothetical protein